MSVHKHIKRQKNI